MKFDYKNIDFLVLLPCPMKAAFGISANQISIEYAARTGNSDILSLTIEQAYKTYPFLDDFFLSCAIESPAKTDMRSLGQWIEELEYFTLDEVGFDRDELL